MATAALADRIQTNDGRDLEGTIVKETSKAVTIKTRFGELTIERSNIAKLTRGKTRDQEFDDRWKKAKGLSDFFELGQWAKTEGLHAKAKKCWKKVKTSKSTSTRSI